MYHGSTLNSWIVFHLASIIYLMSYVKMETIILKHAHWSMLKDVSIKSHHNIFNRCKQVYWNILRIILLQSEKKSDYVLKFCRNVQYLISWELFPFYWIEYYRRRKATLTNKTPLNVKLRQIIDWWVVTRKRPVNAVIKSPGKLFRLRIKIGSYFDVLSNIVITICTFNLIWWTILWYDFIAFLSQAL